MKISAVSVTTSDLTKTVSFYELLGFSFPPHKDEDHLEPKTPKGGARLMIDTKELVQEIIGDEPKHGNHSSFAIEYESSEEVDKIVDKIKLAGFTIIKEPWDAFWGQRYAIVCDPDGYKVDLYAKL